jgi:hypothetical protein
MAYSTQCYVYHQFTKVLVINTDDGFTFTYRFENPMYAKRLNINLGVDNVLLFQAINQQEKPVNISGSNFVFRVMNTAGDRILLEKEMVILNPGCGRFKVTFTREELLELIAQPAYYSIQRHSGNLVEPVFTDSYAGARAPLDIVDSVFPEFVPSRPLTLPTLELSSQYSYGGSSFENYPNWAGQYWGGDSAYFNSWMNTEYFSSHIAPANSLTTVQISLIGYTGTIKAQWAETYESIWYNITESRTFYNHYGTIHWNIEGWFPLLRMAFNNSLFSTPKQPAQPAIAYAVCEDGHVVDILLQNGGAGYLAPPRVDLVGDGSGATAEATIDTVTGTVTGITITNPGSGYWPVPIISYNGQVYPVPPGKTGAIVLITTGYIENMYYR